MDPESSPIYGNTRKSSISLNKCKNTSFFFPHPTFLRKNIKKKKSPNKNKSFFIHI